VLREELPEYEPEPGEDGGRGGFAFDDGDRGESLMDYVLLFPSVIENARDFAFHQLFFRFLRQKTDADFRDTGRTYDPVSESYFEDGFAVSGIHLMTSDQKKRLPEFPKKPDQRSFEKFRDAVAFQIAIDLDQVSYGAYPVMGIPPSEALEAIKKFGYGEFVEKFARSCDRVSVVWGKSGG
jgi:hypothetical protein